MKTEEADFIENLVGNILTNPPVFHRSHDVEKFEQFNFTDWPELGLHVGTEQQARRRRSRALVRMWKLEVEPKNPLRLIDMVNFTPRTVIKQLLFFNILTQEQADNYLGIWREYIFSSGQADKQVSALLRSYLISLGYDSVVYLNRFEGTYQRAQFPRPAVVYVLIAGTNIESDESFLRRNHASDSYIILDPSIIKKYELTTEYAGT